MKLSPIQGEIDDMNSYGSTLSDQRRCRTFMREDWNLSLVWHCRNYCLIMWLFLCIGNSHPQLHDGVMVLEYVRLEGIFFLRSTLSFYIIIWAVSHGKLY